MLFIPTTWRRSSNVHMVNINVTACTPYLEYAVAIVMLCFLIRCHSYTMCIKSPHFRLTLRIFSVGADRIGVYTAQSQTRTIAQI